MKIIIYFIIDFLIKFKLLTKLSRVIVMRYDNDCNANIVKNGELYLIKFLSRSNFFNKTESLSCKEKEYFFDIGANEGQYTKILHFYFIKNSSKEIKKKKREREREIIAFDPSIYNLKKIKKLNLNFVKIENYAVSNKNGKSPFFSSKNYLQSASSSIFDMRTIGYASKNIVKTTVKTITLDDYCSKNKILQIKFLKMDVEGNEFNIIKGAKSLLKKGKIDFIQFEFGHAARAGRIYLFDIIDLLAKYNYFTYVIKPKKIEKIIYSPFIENRYNMGNFVAFKNDKLPHISKIIG